MTLTVIGRNMGIGEFDMGRGCNWEAGRCTKAGFPENAIRDELRKRYRMLASNATRVCDRLIVHSLHLYTRTSLFVFSFSQSQRHIPQWRS